MNIRRPLSNGRDSRDLNEALEAYTSCQHAKSLFFWLILLFLLVQGAAFLVVDLGKTRWAIPPASSEHQSDFIRDDSGSPSQATWYHCSGVLVLDESAGSAELDSGSADSAMPEVVTPGAEGDSDSAGPGSDDELPDNGMGLPSEQTLRQAEALRGMVQVGLTTSKYILTFSVVMYSLCLLVALQVVLVGRLGGAADSTKAFLISLLLAIIVVPWTRMICGWAPGVMFNLAELEKAYWVKVLRPDGDILLLVKYYGRFVGFWLLALLLTLVAQSRSCHAERRIRARLETIEKPASASTETEI